MSGERVTTLTMHPSIVLDRLRALVEAVGVLPENGDGTIQGQELNRAYVRAVRVLEAIGEHD